MPTVGALRQHHPDYDDMVSRWERYRAFTSDLDRAADKKRWLPKGKHEWQSNYDTRLALTHHVGWSRPAVVRMSGSLTKNGADLSWPEDSTTPESVRQQVDAFRNNADGAGRSIDSWWRDVEPEVLTMGLVLAEVARNPAPGARTAGDEPLPFLCKWDVEELINWDVDDKGNLLWVVLRREVSRQATWTSDREVVDVFRVLTREEGFVLEAASDAGDDDEPSAVRAWTHNLGLVPLVPIYAHRRDHMCGSSYVDALTMADWRVLQLESDQAWVSYSAANPLLVVATERELGKKVLDDGSVEGLGLGTSPVIKLRPDSGDLKEWVKYVGPEVAGIEVREGIIDRTDRKALNTAGIDPNAINLGEANSGRSGTAIAWAHSTAEEPTLAAFTENMDAADRMILELAVRWMVSSDSLPIATAALDELRDVASGDDDAAAAARLVLNEAEAGLRDARAAHRAFDGIIKRQKKWDMMSAQTTADLWNAVWVMMKSETARRIGLKDLFAKLHPNATQEEREQVSEEIDALDLADPKPAQMPESFGADGRGDNEDGEEDDDGRSGSDEDGEAHSRSAA